MKSLIVKILIVAILVACFGGGVWQVIDRIEDHVISTTVGLIENSEFIAELRVLVNEIAMDVIHDMLSQGYTIVTEDSGASTMS